MHKDAQPGVLFDSRNRTNNFVGLTRDVATELLTIGRKFKISVHSVSLWQKFFLDYPFSHYLEIAS